MFLQNEYEWSRYNLEEADVAGQRARFDLYDKVRKTNLQPICGSAIACNLTCSALC